MKRYATWGWFAVFVAVVAALAVSYRIAVRLIGLDASQNQAIAAWVQALGSIAAIVGAYAVAVRQESGHAKRVEAEQRQSAALLAHTACFFARDARAAVQGASDLIRNHVAGDPFVPPTDRLEDAQFSMRGLLARPLPPEIVAQVLLMQREVTHSLRALQQLSGEHGPFNQQIVAGATSRWHGSAVRCSHIENFARQRYPEIRVEVMDEHIIAAQWDY